MTCKDNYYEKKKGIGAFAMKKQLWNKAFEAMRKQYEDPLPVEILNRFYFEQAEMRNTDIIIYLNLLAVMADAAKACGEGFEIRGAVGASFISYLFGTTDVNPLKPHYHCPVCHKIIFDDSVRDGWDLPERQCSCGAAMQSDGHDLPYEATHESLRSEHFCVSVTENFFKMAQDIVEQYFSGCKFTYKDITVNRVRKVAIFSNTVKFSITICIYDELEHIKSLRESVGEQIGTIPIEFDELISELCKGDTAGIPEFSFKLAKELLDVAKPESYHDLIQFIGVMRGVNTWYETAAILLEAGFPIGNVIAYPEDVFHYVKNKLKHSEIYETGFAYRVMDDVRHGRYAKDGIPPHILAELKRMGAEDWFVNSIKAIRFLFSKAQGVTHAKRAVEMMWYKIHFPKEFAEIMGDISSDHDITQIYKDK